MVALYFGLPGSGKTTLLTKFVLDAIKSKKYKNVYCNIPLNINGLININEEDLGVYQIDNGLIVFDESTIAFDSRNFNKRSKNILDFFMLHRHYNTDILLFAQGWDTCDKRIRQITDRVYYVYKGWLTGFWFTKYWRIPYDILFPDPKRGNEGLGQIIQGYKKPSVFVRIFAKKCFRPKYYKYFDSWSAPVLKPLPSDRLYINAIESNAIEREIYNKDTDDIYSLIWDTYGKEYDECTEEELESIGYYDVVNSAKKTHSVNYLKLPFSRHIKTAFLHADTIVVPMALALRP